MTSSANTAARVPAASPSFDTDYVGEMVPLEADRLGVLPEVNRLARLLAASKVNPPIALGLFGRWGSGKSFFMGLLKTRIRELGKADDAGGYVDNPVQISFNAWHYQDTSLWANLALRIFDGIAHALEGDRPTDIEATRRELHQKLNSSQRQKEEAEERRSAALRKRNEVAVQLEDTTRERLNKDRELSVTRFTRVWGAVTTRGALRNDVAQLKKEAAALGVKADLSSSEDLERLEKNLQEIERHGRGLTAAVAGSFRDPASTAISLAVLAALAAIVIAIGWLMPRLGLDGVLKTIAQGATPVVAAAGWASRRVQQMTHALDTTTRLRKAISDEWTLSEPTAAEKELSARIAVLDGDIRKHTEEITSADQHVAEAAAELLRIDSGGLVYDFLRDRRASNQYLSHVGLISTIRQDFERLRELLEDFSTNGNKQKIGRIILYIDDLDRCESDKVVEVLQAVHLLLAFDIFNVVVGVDGRWLERSLDARYQANTKAPFTAQEYLEKIFQIPYALTAMSEPGFVELVGDLVTGTERPRPLPALDIRDQVEAIALQSYEEAFLKRLAPFIETPRLAKRMTNIYRLLRARAAGDDLETFAGKATAGTYRAALVLLAINMGYPQVGRKILYELARNPSEPSFDALLERMADPKQGSLADDERTAIARIRTLAAPLDNGSALGLAPYVQWAPNVGVYSFDWHPLGNGQLSGQTSPHP